MIQLMKTISIIVLVLLCATNMVVNHYQQKAITALTANQQIETTRIAFQSEDIAQLRRELEALKATENLRLMKVEKQTDLLMAASRGGWRAAERLLRSAEFRSEAGW